MTAGKAPTREKEIRSAAHKARMPNGCYRVFFAMLDKADFGTAALRGPWQPRSVSDIAHWAEVSEATAKRALTDLERHGWIERRRNAGLGRGHKTSYAINLGVPWPERESSAVSGAERTRRWRERKVAHNGVTGTWKEAQMEVTRDTIQRHITAAQHGGSAGRAVTEGVGKGKPLCAVCLTPLDPVLPAAGYRTHPCCDPKEVAGEPWAA